MALGLLPELYYVPASSIEAERKIKRDFPTRMFHGVGQSLWWFGQMLEDGLLEPSDLDPLGRHRRRATPPVAVQAVFLPRICRPKRIWPTLVSWSNAWMSWRRSN